MNNTELLTQQSGHLAWCALVALQLARLDGKVLSEAQESLFIIRWLAEAQKQRRFPRNVAEDIDWLLKQGRQFGVRAKLSAKLDYLWRSCTGEIGDQNELFRLTYALETAKDAGWVYQVLSDREWLGKHAKQISVGANTFCVSRSSLDCAFDDDGGQIQPVLVRLTGNIPDLRALFVLCGWDITPAEADTLSPLYSLIAKGKDIQTPAT